MTLVLTLTLGISYPQSRRPPPLSTIVCKYFGSDFVQKDFGLRVASRFWPFSRNAPYKSDSFSSYHGFSFQTSSVDRPSDCDSKSVRRGRLKVKQF